MRVMCIQGAEGILTEGDIYTVVEITQNGNFLLDEVNVPEPFTSFDSSRFVPLTSTTEDELVEEDELVSDL